MGVSLKCLWKFRDCCWFFEFKEIEEVFAGVVLGFSEVFWGFLGYLSEFFWSVWGFPRLCWVLECKEFSESFEGFFLCVRGIGDFF